MLSEGNHVPSVHTFNQHGLLFEELLLVGNQDSYHYCQCIGTSRWHYTFQETSQIQASRSVDKM